MNWPEDADGDVFRRLEAENFDFSKQYTIDFKVDFSNWPPTREALDTLRSAYPGIEIIESAGEGANGKGYAAFQISDSVSYDLVTATQSKVTKIMKRYGGWCYSWGIQAN